MTVVSGVSVWQDLRCKRQVFTFIVDGTFYFIYRLTNKNASKHGYELNDCTMS